MSRPSGVFFLFLLLSLVVMMLISARENARLKAENEVLILKNDSLHMLQLKTKKDLIYSNNKIDSISTNPGFRKKVK